MKHSRHNISCVIIIFFSSFKRKHQYLEVQMGPADRGALHTHYRLEHLEPLDDPVGQ